CPLVGTCRDETRAIDKNIPGHGLVEADDVLHEARFSAPRSAQDHHDLAAMHVKRCVIEQYSRTVSHAQISHTDDRSRRCVRCGLVCVGLIPCHYLQLVRTANRPSITTTNTMLVTPALVAD